MHSFHYLFHFYHNIIVQILGYGAMFIGILSFMSHKQNNTRFVLGVSNFFWSLHYYILNAYTTAATQLVLVIRNFLSIYITSVKIKHCVFWIAVALLTGLCVLTWQGWKSLIPLAAGLNSTYALCYLDNKKMRQIMIITSLLWMLNGFIWHSWPQVIAEVIKVIINVFVTKRISGDINAEDVPTEEKIIETSICVKV